MNFGAKIFNNDLNASHYLFIIKAVPQLTVPAIFLQLLNKFSLNYHTATH